MATNKRRPRGDGMIRLRSDGRWEGRATIGHNPLTGKRITKSVYGKTQDEVRKKIKKITAEYDNGEFLDASTITLKQWINIYLTECSLNLKDTTLTDYNNSFNNHIIPALGNYRLTKLTPSMIQRFYNALLIDGRIQQETILKDGTVKPYNISSRGLSPKTIKNIHSVLHSCLDYACKPPYEYLKYNPSDHITLPKQHKPDIRILSEDEIRKLFKNLSVSWHYPIYYICLFTGMRRGEVLGLRKKDIDYENLTITINYQLQREKTGNKQLRLVSLKNDKPRTVYPPQSVFTVIKKYLPIIEFFRDTSPDWHTEVAYGIGRTGIEYKQDELLFCNINGLPFDPDAINKYLQNACKKCGIEGFSMHGLRHTYATLSLKNGDDIKTLSETLGHYDASFTLKQYAHSLESMKRSSQANMEDTIKKILN